MGREEPEELEAGTAGELLELLQDIWCCKSCVKHAIHLGEIRNLIKSLELLIIISWVNSYTFIGRYQFYIWCKRARLGNFRA